MSDRQFYDTNIPEHLELLAQLCLYVTILRILSSRRWLTRPVHVIQLESLGQRQYALQGKPLPA